MKYVRLYALFTTLAALGLLSCSQDEEEVSLLPPPTTVETDADNPLDAFRQQVETLDSVYGIGCALRGGDEAQPYFAHYLRAVVTADAVGTAYGTLVGGDECALMGGMLGGVSAACELNGRTEQQAPKMVVSVDVVRGWAWAEDVLSLSEEDAGGSQIGYYHNNALVAVRDGFSQLTSPTTPDETDLLEAVCSYYDCMGLTAEEAEAARQAYGAALQSGIQAYVQANTPAGDYAAVPSTGLWTENSEALALVSDFATKITTDAADFDAHSYTIDYLALVGASALTEDQKQMLRNAASVAYAGSKLWQLKVLRR